MKRGSKLREAARQIYGEKLAKIAIRSIDIIGDIAIIKVPDPLMKKRFEYAEKILELLPSINTIFRQRSPVTGSYRLRDLEFLAGKYKTLTIHKEYGCKFYVDVMRTYFTPRLATERWRIANLTRDGETIVNMFAGIGPYSILIAKHRKETKIYSIDINYDAVKLHKWNVKLNKVENYVTVYLGDAEEVIMNNLVKMADRVLMPLPEHALGYLSVALSALRDEGWLHIYLHVPYNKNRNEALDLGVKIVKKHVEKFKAKTMYIKPNIVREVATRNLQICIDINVIKNG